MCFINIWKIPLWARSHILKVLSREDDMSVSVPFWGNTRSLTTPSWPWRSKTALPKGKEKKKTSDLKIHLIQPIKTNRHRKIKISPVKTFQILITPFSKPVARSRLFFPSDRALAGHAVAFDFGGLGPKASPHTGWPQLKLLSPLSVSPFWLSLWVKGAPRVQMP